MKYLKYFLIAVFIFILGYNSIEIKPLDEVKKAEAGFDAAAFARDFLEQTLPPAFDQATPLLELVEQLNQDKEKTFKEFSHSVSIGNIRHFLVKGTGQVTAVNEDDLQLLLQDGNRSLAITLATEFIYGSSIRDAAGLFDIKEFTNNTDMNNVSAEINKVIREEVVKPFKRQVEVGDTVAFMGALELNQKFPQIDHLEVLPIVLEKI